MSLELGENLLDIESVSQNTFEVHLQHPNGDPFTHQKVVLLAPGVFHFLSSSALMEIGEYTTDRYGNFSFQISENIHRDNELVCKVVEEILMGRNTFGHNTRSERAVDKIPFIVPSQSNQINITAHLYEYQTDLPGLEIPKLEIPQNLDERPQQWNSKYLLELFRAGLIGGVKEFFVDHFPFADNIEDLGEIFHVYNPELKLSSETTVDLLLNGLYPCHFLKTREDGFTHLVKINWDRYDLDAQDRPIIPNVNIYLKEMNGSLQIGRIAFQTDKNSGWETVNAGDASFNRGLYIANCAAIIKGEIYSHLGLGHLYSGQAAMAVFRAVNLNPIGDLLKPHLRGVLEINEFGESKIFGKDGILNVTGLSEKGIKQSLRDVLGSICYSTFSPREPITETHRFAKAEQLYWKIVSDVVEQFFRENENEIVQKWYEVFYMSKSLVEHSCPYRSLEGESYKDWWNPNEIDNPEFPGRVTHQQELKAIRPITTSLETPGEGDLDRLKQFAKHALFTVTFWHWAVHQSQGKWGSNLKIASLAPRMHVTLPYGDTRVQDASRQMAIVQTFMNFRQGDLIENMNGDIYPYFIEKIIENISEFQKLGYEIEEMPFGTII